MTNEDQIFLAEVLMSNPDVQHYGFYWGHDGEDVNLYQIEAGARVNQCCVLAVALAIGIDPYCNGLDSVTLVDLNEGTDDHDEDEPRTFLEIAEILVDGVNEEAKEEKIPSAEESRAGGSA